MSKRFLCVKCFYICRMDPKQIELLEQIGSVFMRYGIRSVNMDDIAREIKVSKKTLYKYFKDKNDIVIQVMSGQCEMEKVMVANSLDSAENAIDALMNLTSVVSQKLKEVHPSIHYDLEKYYPEAWALFTNHKECFIKDSIATNLARGVKERIYRDNLNSEIIARLYAAKIDMLFDPTIFPPDQFSFPEVYLELMRYHIRGVANQEGMSYLKERIKQKNLNL